MKRRRYLCKDWWGDRRVDAARAKLRKWWWRRLVLFWAFWGVGTLATLARRLFLPDLPWSASWGCHAASWLIISIDIWAIFRWRRVKRVRERLDKRNDRLKVKWALDLLAKKASRDDHLAAPVVPGPEERC